MKNLLSLLYWYGIFDEFEAHKLYEFFHPFHPFRVQGAPGTVI